MMYNMISGTGVAVDREGTPDSLNHKSGVQSILGAAYNETLFISFSTSSEDSKVHPARLSSTNRMHTSIVLMPNYCSSDS